MHRGIRERNEYPKSGKIQELLHSLNSFFGGSDDKESACNAGGMGSVPVLGGCPGEGNDYPLQYSCLEKSMDRGAWWAIVHIVTKSQTRLRD